MRRCLLAALVLVGLVAPVATARATSTCSAPVLVLAAMPLELSPLLRQADVADDVVEHEGRTFYKGTLEGHEVVLAMTGIGLTNAAETTRLAIEELGCRPRAVVFSGVAGSRWKIGDVAVPARWTLDDGKTWLGVDHAMYAAAKALQRPGAVRLADAVPAGDAACACPGVDGPDTPVAVAHRPRVVVGGSGMSYDNFAGKALPCLPGGGDVAGCQPCMAPGSTAQDAQDFAANAPDLADPEFFRGLFTPPQETTQSYASQDMETAAAAEVARRHRVPFLGFRGVSDGRGDPLGLPGFPVQFFVYRQLAADNAAATVVAFLSRWR